MTDYTELVKKAQHSFEMIKSIEYIEPMDIKPLCKYLLPCGICDLTKKQCNTDFIKVMTINGCNKK